VFPTAVSTEQEGTAFLNVLREDQHEKEVNHNYHGERNKFISEAKVTQAFFN
jgi:hypothetical protein